MPSASQRRASSATVEGMSGAQTTQPALTLASAAVRSSTDLAPPAPAATPAIEHQARQLRRLRRIEGQMRGLQNMVDEDRCCPDIMTQISSVHEALRAVGRELVREHVRRCTTPALDAGRFDENELHEELIEMMYKLSR